MVIRDPAEHKGRRLWSFYPHKPWSSGNSWVICNNFELCRVLGPHYCKQSDLNSTINIGPIVIRKISLKHSEFGMREAQRALWPKAQGLRSLATMRESPKLGQSCVCKSLKLHREVRSTSGVLQVVQSWFYIMRSSNERVSKRASHLEVIWN